MGLHLRKAINLIIAIVVGCCLCSTVSAYTYGLSASPSDTVPVNAPVTMTFTTNDSAAVTVTFVWHNPAGEIVFTDGPVTIVDGIADSVYVPTVAGDWLVEVTANNDLKRMRGFAVQDLFVLPEFPLLGSLGGLGVMLLAFGLRKQ